jgi:hypothetical protein
MYKNVPRRRGIVNNLATNLRDVRYEVEDKGNTLRSQTKSNING